MEIPAALALSLAILAPFAPRVTAQETRPAPWSQWRGPGRDGQSPGPAWPERLGLDRIERQWRVELGPSYSGPVVSRDLVFTTATEERRDEVVRALDRVTGEERWSARWEGTMEVPFFARKNGSWIRSTPACDGESLFVAGMRDVLVCLDAASGAIRWRVDFVERHGSPMPDFGFVCSPLVTDESVFVQGAASLVKLDKRTGETLWRSLKDSGGMFGGAFSSPVLAELGGVPQLLVQTRTALCGVAPEAGEVLWSVPIKAFRGMNILTPLAIGDRVFTASYGGRSQLFELKDLPRGKPLEPRWQQRTQGYMTSPVLVDGHIYLLSRSNRFVCLRASDGKMMWTSEPTGDQYWSLIAQGRRILALSDRGELRLIRATPEKLELIDRLELCEEPTWAHLAVDGDQIFIRELGALSAFTWR